MTVVFADTVPPFEVPAGFDPEAVLAAVAAIRAYCGWHIAPSISEIVVLDGTGSDVVIAPTMHLTAVTAISVTRRSMIGPVAVDPATIEWSAAGVLRGRDLYTPRLRGLSVTLTHGYDTWPTELRAVALGLARAGLAPFKVTQQGAGPFTMTMSEQGAAGPLGVGTYEQAVLEPFRRPPSP